MTQLLKNYEVSHWLFASSVFASYYVVCFPLKEITIKRVQVHEDSEPEPPS